MPDKKPKLRGNDPRLFHPQNTRRLRRGYRRIHLPSGIWEWKTNGYEVTIYSPKRLRYFVRYSEMLNMTEKEWDEYRWNWDWDDFGHSILPSEIRDYITKNLVK